MNGIVILIEQESERLEKIIPIAKKFIEELERHKEKLTTFKSEMEAYARETIKHSPVHKKTKTMRAAKKILMKRIHLLEGLSQRTKNTLAKAGVRTIKQLTKKDLKKIKGLGKNGLQEINTILQELGLL